MLVGSRIDQETDSKIRARCQALGCKKSDYFRRLIMQDLQATIQGAPSPEVQKVWIPQIDAQRAKNHQTYYIHKSNPNIKLIDRITQNGETYFLDTEGRKWLMDDDKSLIGVARVIH